MNRVYRALADPTRRRILALLRQGDMTAGELAQQFEQSWPTMSGHFGVLRDADLIAADRVGNTIRYHLNASVLEEALLTLLETLGVDRSSADAVEATDPARPTDLAPPTDRTAPVSRGGTR